MLRFPQKQTDFTEKRDKRERERERERVPAA